VFFDNTGIPSIIEMGYELTSSVGRIVLIGVPRMDSNINIFSLPLHFGKTITGSHGGECRPEEDIPRYAELIKQKKITLAGLITSRFELDQINDAILSMRNGSTAGRVVIKL